MVSLNPLLCALLNLTNDKHIVTNKQTPNIKKLSASLTNNTAPTIRVAMNAIFGKKAIAISNKKSSTYIKF